MQKYQTQNNSIYLHAKHIAPGQSRVHRKIHNPRQIHTEPSPSTYGHRQGKYSNSKIEDNPRSYRVHVGPIPRHVDRYGAMVLAELPHDLELDDARDASSRSLQKAEESTNAVRIYISFDDDLQLWAPQRIAGLRSGRHGSPSAGGCSAPPLEPPSCWRMPPVSA